MTIQLAPLILSLLATAAIHPITSAAAIHGQQAEPQAAKPTAPAADTRLSPEIIAQHQKFQRLLPAETKRELDRLAPIFQKEVAHAKPGTDLRALASAPIRKEFRKALPMQTATLVFELIAQSLDVPKDPASETPTQNQLALQMTADQRSQLEDILANLLKTFQDTPDALIQNIK